MSCGLAKSFHTLKVFRMNTVARIGFMSGRMIVHSVR